VSGGIGVERCGGDYLGNVAARMHFRSQERWHVTSALAPACPGDRACSFGTSMSPTHSPHNLHFDISSIFTRNNSPTAQFACTALLSYVNGCTLLSISRALHPQQSWNQTTALTHYLRWSAAPNVSLLMGFTASLILTNSYRDGSNHPICPSVMRPTRWRMRGTSISCFYIPLLLYISSHRAVLHTHKPFL